MWHHPACQDLLCWRGYGLYDCSAEFRLFWLHSKLAEDGVDGSLAQGLGNAEGQTFRWGRGGARGGAEKWVVLGVGYGFGVIIVIY